MNRFIQTLEEVIETEERRRDELKERAQKLHLNGETVSLIKEYDYALFHLIFSLKSIVSELKDIY
ncbi:hypothetical protein J7L81_03435, partial [Candidatus Aerophobetes bacterium]|nr:hypothetical protein [Candidatus Aerophobetes bacterium]